MKKVISFSMRCFCLLLLTQVSCSSQSDDTVSETPDSTVLAKTGDLANAIFSNLGTVVILPTYSDWVDNSSKLRIAVEHLCSTSDDKNLTAAQKAWKTARTPYKQSEAFAFGPAVDLQIQKKVDFSPPTTDAIEAIIAGTQSLDLSFLRTQGVSNKGFAALEYLIFDPIGGNAAILAKFADPMAGARRCQYAQIVSIDLQSNAKALYDAWDSDNGNFSGEFAQAGKGSATYAMVSDAMSALVNTLLNLTETMKLGGLGRPLGKKSGGAPQPDDVESPFSQNSMQDLVDNLLGIQNVYNCTYAGQTGLGLKDYILQTDDDLSQRINDSLNVVLTALRTIPVPLSAAVLNNPNSVENGYEQLRQLQIIMSGQMSSVLGSTVSFSPNDGD